MLNKMNTSKLSVFVGTIVVLMPLISGSAIPMWEYLSRGEKMSHLYSMFAKQVGVHCAHTASTADICRKDLLSHGLNKLQTMSENHLDAMDPYQRGAMDIIWDSMMDGHQTKIPAMPTTERPVSVYGSFSSYEQNPLFDSPNVYKPKPQQAADNNDQDEYANYGSTGLEDSFGGGHNYLTHAPQEASTNLDEQFVFSTGLGSATLEQNWLSAVGPMVVRVRLDGTPVEEDLKKPLPKDEDREEYRFMKQRLPTLEQIAAKFRVPLSRSKV